MKKILGIIATFVIGSIAALSANEWKNITGLGWNLPMDLTFTADEYKNGEEVVLKNQTGLEIFYMGIGEKGFAVKGAIDLNGSGINHEFDNTPFIGANINWQIGAGYAPVHSDKFTLALFGMFGMDASPFYAESTSYDTSFHKEITSKYTEGQIGYMFGANITAMYSPKPSFSLYASCSVNRVLPGAYLVRAEFSDVYANTETYFDTNATTKIIPTIGVCWNF